MKLLAIHTHPVQYVAPQLVWLSSRVSLEVLYLCRQNVFDTADGGEAPEDPGFGQSLQWDQPLLDGYSSTFLCGAGLVEIEGWRGLFWLPAVFRQIRRIRPDAVLLFNHSPLIVGALAALLPLLGIPVLLRTEANDFVRLRSQGSVLLRDLCLNWIYGRSTIIFPISGHGRLHIEKRGVPPERICLVNYAPNTAWLETQRRKWQPQAEELRQQLGIPAHAPVLLYAGRLAPEKDVLLIPQALVRLPADLLSQLHLISVGSGPLQEEWERRLVEILGERFHLLGFLNQSEIGRSYALADALVLPSWHSETWGLVANEALAFGCRVFLSDRVGCAEDLQALGQPIHLFKAGDASGLATVLRAWLEAPEHSSLEHCSDLPDVLDFPRALLAAWAVSRG